MQIVYQDVDVLTHPAIPMNTQDLQVHGVVLLTASTRAASAAVGIGTDTALISDVEVVLSQGGANFDNFNSEFMAQDARIGKKGW